MKYNNVVNTRSNTQLSLLRIRVSDERSVELIHFCRYAAKGKCNAQKPCSCIFNPAARTPLINYFNYAHIAYIGGRHLLAHLNRKSPQRRRCVVVYLFYFFFYICLYIVVYINGQLIELWNYSSIKFVAPHHIYIYTWRKPIYNTILICIIAALHAREPQQWRSRVLGRFRSAHPHVLRLPWRNRPTNCRHY